MTSKRTAIAAAAVLLAAVPLAVTAMPPASAWEIGPNIRGRNYSVGMPARPSDLGNGAIGFEFPREGGEIDAMTTAVGPLAGARRITMRYRIEAARGTSFVPVELPDQTATVSIYLQRAGDSWTAKGKFASYRWYVPDHAVIPLKAGTHTVTIGLDEVWSNVHGMRSTDDPRGFAAALDQTARLGVAFGSAGLRSHGVYATGPARFTLLALDIE